MSVSVMIGNIKLIYRKYNDKRIVNKINKYNFASLIYLNTFCFSIILNIYYNKVQNTKEHQGRKQKKQEDIKNEITR